jgi:hypothetical protein
VSPDGDPPLYWLGAGLVAFLGLLLLPQPRLAQPSTGVAVIALYLLAQSWLWFSKMTYHRHWYAHFALGALLAVPLLTFAAVTLVRTGAADLRRARRAIGRLLRRTHWPADLSLCQTLPEVMALREAVQGEAVPALALLQNARPEVRASALAALAYRTVWLPGQAERVQYLAQHAREPAVRAAAIRALAFSRDPYLVETLAKSLRDPAPEVRRAAAEVLLWDGERRWAWVRFNIHEALADPALSDEGPLPLGGVTLPTQALTDLYEWASEGGDLSVRAARTLVAYYGQVLNARADAGEVAAQLRQTILDPGAPTILRVELGQLLYEQRLLDADTLTGLLAPDNPVPLRLVGADAALQQGPHPAAVRTLCEIARRPNREIALAVAQIVQRRLGVDLGLKLHHPPAPHSRQAAELTRRVMEWAAEVPPEDDEPAGPGAGGPAYAAAARTEDDWEMPPVPPRLDGGDQIGPNITYW